MGNLSAARNFSNAAALDIRDRQSVVQARTVAGKLVSGCCEISPDLRIVAEAGDILASNDANFGRVFGFRPCGRFYQNARIS